MRISRRKTLNLLSSVLLLIRINKGFSFGCFAVRSCLKSGFSAHEKDEKDEKSGIIIFFCLYFRAFRVFRGQNLGFSNSFLEKLFSTVDSHQCKTSFES
jgi:hypothetical protein